MLKLLQSGCQPLGQFDLLDGALLVGGEIGVMRQAPLNETSADGQGLGQPRTGGKITLVTPGFGQIGLVRGFLDDGVKGYGTLFGDIIGMTAGQGTGFGAQFAKGVVHVGPQTTAGSGKATLWTNPGLYGVTSDAWAIPAEQATVGLNAKIYGTIGTGKLSLTVPPNPPPPAPPLPPSFPTALSVGLVQDRSLVSTTNGLADAEFLAVYLLGPQY